MGGMSKDTGLRAMPLATETDTGPPFGLVYLGTLIAVIGLVLTLALPGALGPVAAISGVLLVCTGLVLRGLYRLR
jgi:hypothetical protein